MESGYEATSTLRAVEKIVTIFRTSQELYQKWRKKRKGKQPAEEELEVSLVLGAKKVQSRSKELENIWGSAFDRGDDIARDGLLEASRTINSSLLQVLRSSLEPGQINGLRPSPLWRVSEINQDQTIAILCDLGHRLQVAARGPVYLRDTRLIVWRRPRQSAEALVDVRNSSDNPISSRQLVVHPQFDARSSQIEPASSTVMSKDSDSIEHSIAGQTNSKSVSDLLREWRQDLDARKLSITPPWLSISSSQEVHDSAGSSGISVDRVAPTNFRNTSSMSLGSASDFGERSQDRVDQPRSEPFCPPLLQLPIATYSTTSLHSGFSTRIVSCPSRINDTQEDD